MDTAFVIGNGESRPIFPIQDLKNKGIIYGCNAIYRDNPTLCDHIVAVNQPMYEELQAGYKKIKSEIKIYEPYRLYICSRQLYLPIINKPLLWSILFFAPPRADSCRVLWLCPKVR